MRLGCKNRRTYYAGADGLLCSPSPREALKQEVETSGETMRRCAPDELTRTDYPMHSVTVNLSSTPGSVEGVFGPMLFRNAIGGRGCRLAGSGRGPRALTVRSGCPGNRWDVWAGMSRGYGASMVITPSEGARRKKMLLG